MTSIAREIALFVLICIISAATAGAAERQYAPDRKVDVLHQESDGGRECDYKVRSDQPAA